jgi:hypothetical protein
LGKVIETLGLVEVVVDTDALLFGTLDGVIEGAVSCSQALLFRTVSQNSLHGLIIDGCKDMSTYGWSNK